MPDSFPPTERLPASDHPLVTVRVWDLPTRIFHWALAAVVLGLIGTGLAGVMDWHFRLGYCALALLVFRLVWGFVGGYWSRFGSFLYSPSSLSAYLKGRAHPDHLVGHSPTGALSVFALLLLLAAQVATGLMADDEISNTGPLSHLVSNAVASAATSWHAGPGKVIIIALVVLHLLAVLFYVLVKRHRLVRPMVQGDKQLSEAPVRSSRDDALTRVLALVLLAVGAGVAAWVASLRV